MQMVPILATARPCQMARNKEEIRSAVGLLQCSRPRMMVPRRVGIEISGDPGCPEHLAPSSRFRGELVSLGSAGGGWTGGWPRCVQHTASSAAVLQSLTPSIRRRSRRSHDIPCAPRRPLGSSSPWTQWLATLWLHRGTPAIL
jgi:hypothetical protein